uniref:ATP synthase complex subunit 8 n=1 Tax=Indirana semipalmata TaxID=691012 RepID=A0A1D9CIW5_9NEOB|nr:ATP synthase F0 subunit 8 [Indirana semipalmata]
MPQLILDPWLIILLSSWLTLIFLAPKKLLTSLNLKELTKKTTKPSHPAWTWPWQ